MMLQTWIVRLLLALAFCAALTIFWVSHSALARVAILPHSSACLYGLEARLGPDTQLAVIGSSRMREAVDPPLLQKALGWPDRSVVNLSHPTVAPAYDFATLKAITATDPIDIAIVEVIARSDALRAAERSVDPAPDRVAADLAMGQVRQDYVMSLSLLDHVRRAVREAPNLTLALSDALDVTSKRITTTLALAKTGKLYPGMFRSERTIDKTRDTICALKTSRDTQLLRPDQVATQQAKIDGYRTLFKTKAWQDPAPLGFLTDPGSRHNRYAYDDIVALGVQRGFKVVFLYVPGVFVPVSPDLPAAFEDRFGAPLLVPPQALHATLSTGGYYDNAHLNEAGSARLVDWLADALRGQGIVSSQ